MSVQALKILICDDHELIRDGLKRIVTERGLASSVGEASNFHSAFAAMRQERWDIMVLDINLGGRSGIDLLVDVAKEFPHLPVLMLSAYPEDQFALRAIRAGARGYVSKGASSSVLAEAIRTVMTGGYYVSQKVAEKLVVAARQPLGPLAHTNLSNREDQVLRLIGAGLSVGEIAVQLILSVKTVSTYRAIVLRKLHLSNNAQLMRYALDHNLE